jgi:hypothetical protein
LLLKGLARKVKADVKSGGGGGEVEADADADVGVDVEADVEAGVEMESLLRPGSIGSNQI